MEGRLLKVKEWLLCNSNCFVGFIALICLISIFQIKLQIWPGGYIHSSDTKEIICNLSYSYLAGYVFYLLTVTLPHQIIRSKVKIALERKINTIKSNYKACVDSVVPLPNATLPSLTREDVVETFKTVSYFQPCRISAIQGVNESIIEYISIKHDENKHLATELLEYKTFLSSEAIALIEDIRNSRLPYIIGTLTGNAARDQIDSNGGRELLAEFVFDLWDLAKQIKY